MKLEDLHENNKNNNNSTELYLMKRKLNTDIVMYNLSTKKFEVKKEIKKENTIADQGYNVYRRDANSEIYRLENATEFYIKNNIMYIIYCYGNNSYTSEVDLIITKV